MEGPHQRFHTAGLSALRHFFDGEYQQGFDAMGAMEAASMEVLGCLERVAASGEDAPALLRCS